MVGVRSEQKSKEAAKAVCCGNILNSDMVDVSGIKTGKRAKVSMSGLAWSCMVLYGLVWEAKNRKGKAYCTRVAEVEGVI